MLKRLPKSPAGVKYALTVPQSVLFADLSLQGNRREIFQRALQIDYEPHYVAIDSGGAMSWNYDQDARFEAALLADRSPIETIGYFIETMERTARELNKVSKSVESPRLRRINNHQDLLDDLNSYWDAYKNHMTSLFTFWNVEHFLAEELPAKLAGLLTPSEPNYFVLERRQLRKIAHRFAPPSSTYDPKNPPAKLTDALQAHIADYSFLLAPFNLGKPPSPESLLQRLRDAPDSVPTPTTPPSFDTLESDQKKLAQLAQRFIFWKTERLDLFALADARVQSLYTDTATALSLSLSDLFALTSTEIATSLAENGPVISTEQIKVRQNTFCLALINGTINFYQPTANITHDANDPQPGSSVEGMSASAGTVSGIVRVIGSEADLPELKRGEIMVTTMTRPEYGAALDRATAFITDEGGMLCHAAIIARELKKPCIVGTHNATKLLKTGDKIKLDAGSGKVTIL